MKQFALFLVGFLFAVTTFAVSSCENDKDETTYKIKQYYHVKKIEGISYYGISTFVFKCEPRKYSHDKKTQVYSDYARCVYEELDSLMMTEYDQADKERQRFARVDNMINKTNNED